MENQVIHESALITQTSEIHNKYKTLLHRTESERSGIVESAKMELDELKRTLATSEKRLNEWTIASTNLEITAAEERADRRCLEKRRQN